MQDYIGKDALAEWCAKEMRLNIDGKEFIVRPTMEHYRRLKALAKSSDENEARQVLKDILITTFPNSQSVDLFLERYEQKMQMAIVAEVAGLTVEELKKKLFQNQ